ncbi:MAG: RrF2 family transcriptional regulator [bacterium]
MQLTRAGEYAIRCVLYLSQREKGTVSLLEDICKAQDSPRYLSAKVLQTLVRGGIVKSTRGAGGGYCLAQPSSNISMLQVIECVEGPLFLNFCLRQRGECEHDRGCQLYPIWGEAQTKLKEVLSYYTFDKLAGR